MNILRQLADEAEIRVENKRKEVSDEEIRHQALLKSLERRREGRGWNFEKSLAGPGISVIAELKKASPSKGMICEDFDYLRILGLYEQAGASCISCLTEPAHFLGSTEILRDVCSNTKLPVLCKDFTVDEYQIYEACAGGASAVLLIAALLSEKQISSMLETADSLAMSALVETHSAEEIEKAVNAGARVIGINNRDLRSFTVDLSNSIRLSAALPRGAVFVSESGIKTPEDVGRLADAGADAVLIGETLMTSDNIQAAMEALLGSPVEQAV